MRPINSNKDYYTRDRYIVTVDMEQKKKLSLKGKDGEDVDLTIRTDLNSNHRISHPNYATITATSKDCQFKVGTEVICNHFAFEDGDRKSKVLYSKDGVDYFSLENLDLMFAVIGGKLTPREGVLLCEPVDGKLIDTELEVLRDYEGHRRDIAKILDVWDGCKDYVAGEYVILAKGGDYLFDHNGKEYIKVDTYFDDDLAVVESPEWRLTEVREHAKHNETIYI